MRPRRILRVRTCFRVCSSLALGLLTSVAVALVLAARPSEPWFGSDTSRFFERYGAPWTCFETHFGGQVSIHWRKLQPVEPGETPSETLAAAWRSSEHGVVGAPPYAMSARRPYWGTLAAPDRPPSPQGIDHGAGWPLVCLWYREFLDQGCNTVAMDGWWSFDGHRPVYPGTDRFQPWWVFGGDRPAKTWRAAILPRWPAVTGLAVDMACYAAAWGGLLFLPGAARRRLRRRLGRCTACGYDARALPEGAPCPECGSPSPSGSSRPRRSVE